MLLQYFLCFFKEEILTDKLTKSLNAPKRLNFNLTIKCLYSRYKVQIKNTFLGVMIKGDEPGSSPRKHQIHNYRLKQLCGRLETSQGLQQPSKQPNKEKPL